MPNPPLDLYQRNWPIRTTETLAPPARTVSGPSGVKAELDNSMFNSGTVISGGTVAHSILSRNVRVQERALVCDSILFEGVDVGPGAKWQRCIVDKGVRIPPGERIGFDIEFDRQRFTVSESGIVVVPKNYQFEARPVVVESRAAVAVPA